MIVIEHWPIMPPELQPKRLELVQALGAIPSHTDVEFTDRDKWLMGCGMLDYTSQDVGDELRVSTQAADNYLTRAYCKLQGPLGRGKRTWPHLTYIGLRDKHVDYPDLSNWRPELEAPEALALLALAAKKPIQKLEKTLSLRTGDLIGGLGETLGARTYQGMVGKGFMYGFFRPA